MCLIALACRAQDFSPLWIPFGGSGDVQVGDINQDGFLDIVRNDGWLQNLSGTNIAKLPSGTIFNPLSGALALSDVDNDGDLDVTQSGSQGTSRLTRIWTNASPMSPVPLLRDASAMNLQGFFAVIVPPAVSWADFDQDGDRDLILAGFTNTPTTGNFKTFAYRNNGFPALDLVPGVFPHLAYAALGWADFDRDGDLDVCVTGATSVALTTYFAALYSNDGAGVFTEIPSGLPAMQQGSVACGDVDNDGWPDLLLAGAFRVGNLTTNQTRLLRSSGAGAFTELAVFAGLSAPSCYLVDLDNDGLLDILFVGGRLPPSGPAVRVYLNRGGQFQDISPPIEPSVATLAIGDLDRDGRVDVVVGTQVLRNNFPATNTPPEMPTNLDSAVLADAVVLSWSEETDANQSGGLTYNVRIGTASGLGNVMSPLADPLTGRRWIAAIGNASQSTRWKLRGLPPGDYYWSVQSVDHALAGSPFALEQSFTIPDWRPRFISAIVTNGTASLQIEVLSPGNYALLTSTNLEVWSALSAAEFPAGRTNLVLEASQQQQFFQLRRD